MTLDSQAYTKHRFIYMQYKKKEKTSKLLTVMKA